jgi:hypothetical protein
VRFYRAALILIATALSALPGCRKEEAIEQYTVEHPDRESLELRVAILPHGEDVFFVRVSGPEAQIKKLVPAFEEFVKSARFVHHDKKGEEPTILFTEPKEWKKDPPVEGRVASYRIEADAEPLEVKVTLFPREKYALLPNIQRWQKEMNLPLAEDAAGAERFVKEGKIADQAVTWVTMHGYGVYKVSAPPQPMAQTPKMRPTLPMRPAQTPFKYEAPKEWVSKPPPDQITAVQFELESKGQIAFVTLTRLGGEGGGLAFNIKRWRGQVMLPEVPEQELVKSVGSLKVAGVPAYYADLDNPKGPAAKNRILGVVVPLGQETWFVKMIGPRAWVGQNKNAFETFLKSFQLDAR